MAIRLDLHELCISHGYPKFLASVAGLTVKTQTNQYKHGICSKDEFWFDDQKIVELDQKILDFIPEMNH